MKIVFSIAFVLLSHSALVAQNPSILLGDWIRVRASYSDGKELPFDHPARIFQRYYFVKDNKALLIMGNTTWPMEYTFTGNQLKLGPVQAYTVERQSDAELVLLEMKNRVRYYFMPTDSFTVSGIMKYAYTVSGADTVYTSTVGIEPIFPKGNNDFMKYIMQGFSAVDVRFVFSFVVQQDGSIGEVTVESSTNVKLNERLIKLVKKSSGQWIPGAVGGRPVNVRVQENINLGRSR